MADRFPPVPLYSVQPAFLIFSSNEVVDPRVRISDFGEAFFVRSEIRHAFHTSLLLLPPEISFSDEPLGPPADIWTLASPVDGP